MKKYLIYYWREINDEPTDLEVIIEAINMEDAFKKFKQQIKVYKHITTITEIN
jgi:hypothetical protein